MIKDSSNNKKKKIDEILSIVKVSALLFSAIAFLQYIFNIISLCGKRPICYGIVPAALISIVLLSIIYNIYFMEPS